MKNYTFDWIEFKGSLHFDLLKEFEIGYDGQYIFQEPT